MKSKIYFIVAAIILISNNAIAKTEGSYLSVDALYSYGKFKERYKDTGDTTWRLDPTNFKGGNPGFGATYKYAFNLNDFYIAPGVFFERNNLTIDSTTTIPKANIGERFGAKLDLGYDLFDSFAIYATGGYAAIRYQAQQLYYGASSDFTRDSSGILGGAFVGGGFKIDLGESVSLFTEFNMQNFNIKTPTGVAGDTTDHIGVFKTHLYVGKLGIAYRF